MENEMPGASGALRGDGDVLITQGLLHRLAGSEVIVIELCEHFSRLGRRVAVVVRSYDADFVGAHLRLPGVEVFSSRDQDLDEHLSRYSFSLAWVHHNVVPRTVLEAHEGLAVVFAHLSPYMVAETAMVPGLERGLASAVVFNSPETMQAHRALGLYDGFPGDRLHVFPNPAPDDFSRLDGASADHDCLRLLLVSNHIPDEVAAALELLEGSVDVVRVGRQGERGATERRVDADLLQGCDAVLSIGKTVQYALTSGRGVFCYDVHGGPGWLGPDNVDRAAGLNFSGRGFGRLEAEQIAEQILAGWRDGVRFATAYRAVAVERYGLTPALGALDRAIASGETSPDGVPADVAASAVQLDRRLAEVADLENKYFQAAHARNVAVAERADLAAKFEAAVASRDEARAARDTALEARDRARDDKAIFVGRFEEAVASREEARADRDRARKERSRFARRLDEANRARDKAVAEAQGMRSSLSWRSTAFLRAGARLSSRAVRRVRRPGSLA